MDLKSYNPYNSISVAYALTKLVDKVKSIGLKQSSPTNEIADSSLGKKTKKELTKRKSTNKTTDVKENENNDESDYMEGFGDLPKHSHDFDFDSDSSGEDDYTKRKSGNSRRSMKEVYSKRYSDKSRSFRSEQSDSQSEVSSSLDDDFDSTGMSDEISTSQVNNEEEDEDEDYVPPPELMEIPEGADDFDYGSNNSEGDDSTDESEDSDYYVSELDGHGYSDTTTSIIPGQGDSEPDDSDIPRTYDKAPEVPPEMPTENSDDEDEDYVPPPELMEIPEGADDFDYGSADSEEEDSTEESEDSDYYVSELDGKGYSETTTSIIPGEGDSEPDDSEIPHTYNEVDELPGEMPTDQVNNVSKMDAESDLNTSLVPGLLNNTYLKPGIYVDSTVILLNRLLPRRQAGQMSQNNLDQTTS